MTRPAALRLLSAVFGAGALVVALTGGARAAWLLLVVGLGALLTFAVRAMSGAIAVSGVVTVGALTVTAATGASGPVGLTTRSLLVTALLVGCLLVADVAGSLPARARGGWTVLGRALGRQWPSLTVAVVAAVLTAALARWVPAEALPGVALAGMVLAVVALAVATRGNRERQ